MALADYQSLVNKMVRDSSDTITAADRDQAIELARLRYSVDAERKMTEDVVWLADGHLGPLPANWVLGSYLVTGEFPIGQQPPSLIELSVYVTPTGEQLMVEDALAAGDTLRVQYAAPHLLTAGNAPADTIPPAHREAVASYAAAVLCKQLASYYSGQRETAMNADASNTDSRSRNYAARAKEYRAAYFAGIGRADPQSDKGGAGSVAGAPAASVSSWEGRRKTNLTRISLP
jgi:hypothetical protein